MINVTLILVLWKKWNNDNKYIILTINVFSKFISTKPLKTRSGNEVLKVLKEIFDENNREPGQIRSDKGTEFVNKNVWAYNKSFTAESTETKANFSERGIRTIKSKLSRSMTEKKLSNEYMFWQKSPHHITL